MENNKISIKSILIFVATKSEIVHISVVQMMGVMNPWATSKIQIIILNHNLQKCCSSHLFR